MAEEERKIAIDEIKKSSEPSKTEESHKGETSYEESTEVLISKLTVKINSHIISVCQALRTQALIIGGICGIVVIIGIILGCKLYTDFNYPLWWSWQMVYFTTARIIVVTGFFYLVNFSFSLLKSYLHLYQRNRHRLFVINSMSNLISSSKEIDRREVHLKLLDIITDFDDAGIIKEQKVIDTDSIEKIVKIIKESIPLK